MEEDSTPARTVTVSLPDRKVIVQDDAGTVIRIYSVYVGSQRFPTLPGDFHILSDTEIATTDPSYNGVFLPFHEYPDPDVDPTGEVERIAVAGFHGWKYGPEDDEEEAINPGWKTTTEGCVQLTDEDMADFAAIVRPGDRVIVRDLPLDQMEHLNSVHRDQFAKL